MREYIKVILVYVGLAISDASAASLHKMAMIQNGVVVNTSVWDDVSPWNPAGYVLVDVSSQPAVSIGWTCSVCDGSDFQPPSQ